MSASSSSSAAPLSICNRGLITYSLPKKRRRRYYSNPPVRAEDILETFSNNGGDVFDTINVDITPINKN